MPCNGKAGKNCSKCCLKFQPKTTADIDKQSKCKNCSHRKKVHVDSTGIQDVLAKYNLGALKQRPTDSEARKETSAGFRPKEGSTATVKVSE